MKFQPWIFRIFLGGRHFREDKIAIYIHLWYSQPAISGNTMKLLPRLISMNNLWFARSMRGNKKHTHTYSPRWWWIMMNVDESHGTIHKNHQQKQIHQVLQSDLLGCVKWPFQGLLVTSIWVIISGHEWKKLANNFVRSGLPSALNSFPSRIRKVQVQTRSWKKNHLATGYTVVYLTLKIHHIHCTSLFVFTRKYSDFRLCRVRFFGGVFFHRDFELLLSSESSFFWTWLSTSLDWTTTGITA